MSGVGSVLLARPSLAHVLLFFLRSRRLLTSDPTDFPRRVTVAACGAAPSLILTMARAARTLRSTARFSVILFKSDTPNGFLCGWPSAVAIAWLM